MWLDLAFYRRIGRSVARSGSLSPDREFCGRIRLVVIGSRDLCPDPARCRRIGSSVASSGSLWPDLSFSVENSPVVEDLEFGCRIETQSKKPGIVKNK